MSLDSGSSTLISLEEIANTVAEGIYVIDRHGTITFINPKGCRLLGYEESEVYGKNAHNMFHHHRLDGSVYDQDECNIAKSIKSGRFYESEDEIFWTKNGDPVPVLVISSPIIRDNENVGSVVAFRDISRQNELENNLKRAVEVELEKHARQDEAYRLLFNSTPIGIGIVDAKGNIVDSNNAFCQMTGYSYDEITKKTVIELTHPDDLSKEVPYHEMMARGDIESFKVEKRLIGKNDKITEIRLTVSEVKDADTKSIRIFGFAEDITEEN